MAYILFIFVKSKTQKMKKSLIIGSLIAISFASMSCGNSKTAVVGKNETPSVTPSTPEEKPIFKTQEIQRPTRLEQAKPVHK